MAELKGFTKLFNTMFNPNNNAGTLLALNTAAMVFAALSNTFAAAKDKNTSAEDKKFLVPAGLVTGVANIGAYIALTSKLIDKLQGVSHIDENGVKVIDKKGVADVYFSKMKPGEIEKNAKKYLTDVMEKTKKGSFFGLKKPDPKYVEHMAATYLDDKGNLKEAAVELYKDSVKSGLGVVGAFIGAVVGCAIITPIIRDVSAYIVQKKMEKNNPSMQDKPYRPYFDPAHLKTGLNHNQNQYQHIEKQPINMKNYMSFTCGMRI